MYAWLCLRIQKKTLDATRGGRTTEETSLAEPWTRRDQVVCAGWDPYRWAHQRTWPRAVGDEFQSVFKGFLCAATRVEGEQGNLEKTHLASNGTLVGGLALDGEGNTVGGLGLDLKGRCRQISRSLEVIGGS